MILLLAIFSASTAVFCMVIGAFTWENVALGMIISALLMAMFRDQIVPRPMAPVGLSMHLILYAPVLVYYLIIDILKGTWQVAKVTLGLEPLSHPGIIKYPITSHSRYGVGPVGYFITLSPGSFLVDIDWDEKVMLVHVLDASNPEALRHDAEKYYRLWEYGDYKPKHDNADDQKERDNE